MLRAERSFCHVGPSFCGLGRPFKNRNQICQRKTEPYAHSSGRRIGVQNISPGSVPRPARFAPRSPGAPPLPPDRPQPRARPSAPPCTQCPTEPQEPWNLDAERFNCLPVRRKYEGTPKSESPKIQPNSSRGKKARNRRARAPAQEKTHEPRFGERSRPASGPVIPTRSAWQNGGVFGKTGLAEFRGPLPPEWPFAQVA